VLGDALNGLQWHVYVAGAAAAAAPPAGAPPPRPLHTLEICMTGLHPDKAAQFVRSDAFVSSQHTTAASGIASLVPGHAIDDYVFEPCGYSMNGQDGAAFSTCHITPEAGFSYASLELCGHAADEVAAAELVARAAAVFRPRAISVALSADSAAPGADAPGWGSAFAPPAGYDCHSASYQEVKCGGYVAFFSLEAAPKAARGAGAAAVAAAAAKGGAYSDGCPSPRGVLKRFPTLGALAAPPSAPSSVDLMATSSDNSSDSGHSTDRHCAAMALGGGPEAPAFDDVAAAYGAAPLARGDAGAIDAHARALIAQHGLEDNFYVVDLGAVQRLYRAWGEALPRVHPHYAVKCNNDPALISALAALGAGFDCASEAEVAQVLGLGVAPERVVFANPCKRPADIRAAAEAGVVLSTFDTGECRRRAGPGRRRAHGCAAARTAAHPAPCAPCPAPCAAESELLKLRRWYPGARVLLRIRADDPTARCPLGNKFGAEEWEWEALLSAAAALGVPVDGVSFHVGSGATNPQSFRYAIEAARRAFDLGAAHGFEMTLLDVGGGFCGGRFGPDGRVDLGGVPAALNAALEAHFPEGSGVRVIAEPGRYFAESVATLGCLVYGRRRRTADPQAPASADAEAAATQFDYWVTDGLYGSMNCLLYDHATLAPRPLATAALDGPLHAATVFGPTCDGLDTVVRGYPLPELEVGDWLAFPRMGAYTLCGASKFNGINAVDVPTFYVASQLP
jgi:ornithine decarboxylase